MYYGGSRTCDKCFGRNVKEIFRKIFRVILGKFCQNFEKIERNFMEGLKKFLKNFANIYLILGKLFSETVKNKFEKIF